MPSYDMSLLIIIFILFIFVIRTLTKGHKRVRSRFPIGSSRELLRPLIHGEKMIYISSQPAANRVTWKEVWFI